MDRRVKDQDPWGHGLAQPQAVPLWAQAVSSGVKNFLEVADTCPQIRPPTFPAGGEVVLAWPQPQAPLESWRVSQSQKVSLYCTSR